MDLQFLQSGRASTRYHTLTMHTYQRIDAHSYGVAQITRYLGRHLPPDRQLELMHAALDHDLPEFMTGDAPAPFKRAAGLREQYKRFEHGELSRWNFNTGVELSAEEQRLLGIADCADGALHCIEERALGNTYAAEPFYNFFSYLLEEHGLSQDKSQPSYSAEVALRRYISHSWEKANGGKW